MTPTRDATVAARVPHDLREDLDRVVELRRKRGDRRPDGDPVDLSTLIRAELRNLADRELGRTPPTDGAGVTSTGLFAAAPGAARSGDPATSKAAALDVAPRTGTQRRRALELIVGAGGRGATADEVIAELELQGLNVAVNGVARRVTDLLQAGAIEELRRLERFGYGRGLRGDDMSYGDVVTRPTRHGSAATVYVATAKGRDWLNANRSQEAAA